MNNKFAGIGEGCSAGSGSWKAPTRDLDSAPSPASSAGGDWSSLTWDTYSPTAGKDQKLSWGSGGEAPGISGVLAGTGLSSLDSIENNRDRVSGQPDYNARPKARGKFCGRYSLRGTHPKTGNTHYRRLNCHSWNCSYCGARKARTARHAIRTHAEALGLCYFLTLTIDPKKLQGIQGTEFIVPYMRQIFNNFRVYLHRQYGQAPNYICVLEFTKAGLPHLHILIDRYIPQAWISATWSKLGGGKICFIKQVKVNRVARYLSILKSEHFHLLTTLPSCR